MSIKKLLVLCMLFYFVLLSPAVLAEYKAYAYVYVGIADAPPRINSIALKPEIAYTDSVISCEADVYDENISFLQVSYEWHLNDKFLQETSGNILQANLQAGDEIFCRIIAADIYQHISNATSQAVKIQPSGFLQATGYAIRNLGEVNPESNGLIYGAVISFGVIVVAGFGFRRLRKEH